MNSAAAEPTPAMTKVEVLFSRTVQLYLKDKITRNGSVDSACCSRGWIKVLIFSFVNLVLFFSKCIECSSTDQK